MRASDAWDARPKEHLREEIKKFLDRMRKEESHDELEDLNSFVIFTPEHRLLWIGAETLIGSGVGGGGDDGIEAFADSILVSVRNSDEGRLNGKNKICPNYSKVADPENSGKLADAIFDFMINVCGMDPPECHRSLRTGKKLESEKYDVRTEKFANSSFSGKVSAGAAL